MKTSRLSGHAPRFIHAAALGVVLACGAGVAGAETVRGTVYHDLNANGMHDGNEPGVPNVLVSDGEGVVATDQNGRYELDIDSDAIVFVVKPSGYRTPIDEQNIPRFYYIHKPEGSPDDSFYYKGVEPTGPLPASVDFPLVRSDEPDRFNVLLFGDPQPYSAREVRLYAEEVLSEAAKQDASFAISLGDLVGDDLDLFEPFNAAQASVGVPFYNVYGNHDMNFLSPNDEYADETFNRVFGPTDYAFEYSGVLFVVLDNVYWKGYVGTRERREKPWVAYKQSFEDGYPITNNYTGRITDRQFDFLENLLNHIPATRRVVLCTHIPLETDSADSPHQVPELDRLMSLFSRFPNTLSFSGHTHKNRHWFFGSPEGYTPATGAEHHHYNVGTASGSWWRGTPDLDGVPHTTMRDGVPNGYAIATFEGSDYSVRYVEAQNNDRHMRIIIPEVLTAEEFRSTEILANIWGTTGVRSTVRARVIRPDGSATDWTTMRFSPRIDPVYAAQREREAAIEDRGYRVSPGPDESHNMFAGVVDVPLSPGLHLLEVEATDMFDQTVRNRQPFEIVAD